MNIKNQLKLCIQCLEDKLLSDFGKDKRNISGLRNECKDCRNIYEKALRNGNTEYKKQQTENTKQWKKNNPDKAKILRDRYNKKNPTKMREAHLKFTFNVTLEQYEVMMVEQNRVCKICALPAESGKNLHIDHDHKTGEIRGLLCGKCNMGLGLFNDNYELINKAIEYLKLKEIK